MEFLDKKLDDYITAHSEVENEVLAELNRQTHLKVLIPRMIAGHYQGRVLSVLSHMIKPKTVLEIGTYTGYSAICFAEGLAENGTIHTIDLNEELESFQSEYFKKSGCADKIVQHVGSALEVIPKLEGNFDLVYIDADKENYCNYYDQTINRINKGGYIIADNVLWSGKVIEPLNPKDEETQMLLEYNKKIQEDNRVQNVLLPIRDGLMIARKL
ncbi:MAG: methyltransferase [Crocinitomicaceae bacterium]|nr:methyltransferase [Crocinitomicaceae bacterium]|tara:strand:- start:69248 stop:69889 length:642 start_codon:yes stop_codon:yes gene_type:complete